MEMISRVNGIYERECDGETVYCVEHTPTGFYSIFDYDEGAKQYIQDMIKHQRKSLTPRSYKSEHSGGLIFGKSRNGSPGCALAVALYSYYHGVPIGDLRRDQAQIRHIAPLGGVPFEDCRKKNLYSTKDVALDTPNRKISITPDGKHILLHIKSANRTEYLTYTPELFNIIARPTNLTFFVNNGGRAQARLNGFSGVGECEPYLAMLAYACYYMGLNEENLCDLMPVIMKGFEGETDCNGKKHEIDHANNDVRNHCKWNLSSMPEELNNRSGKYDYVARIKPPYYLFIAVADNGDYRVDFGYQGVSGFGQVFHIICKDAEHLNDMLRKIMALDKAPAFLKRYQTPQIVWGIDKKFPHAAMNFRRAAAIADTLLSMRESDFTEWTKDTNFVVRDRFQHKENA